ncbi:MAG: ACT domain-containing protein [Candidatus Aenigmarchaeota archaeon]|nr:ACT domain-containing protein [Candidatus Aenigmarchaeota archaeon]
MTIAEMVGIYVKRKPHVKEALEKGIVNYSALARLIRMETGGSEVAVKIALIRIASRLKKQKSEREKTILYLLRNSSMEIKFGVSIAISRSPVKADCLVQSRGPSGYVTVMEASVVKNLKGKDIIRSEHGLDLISIKSPAEIEKVPGVVAYLLDSLGAENINLLHVISTYRDTLLILRDMDTMKAVEILKWVMK